MYSFSYLEPICFLTCIQVSQEAGQVVWYSHLFHNFPQFIVIPRVKGFGIVNKAEIDVFFWNSLAFSIIQKHSSCNGLRGGEELPHAQGQGRRPRVPGCDGAGAAERSYSTSKEQRLHGCRRAERSYSTFKVRRGDLVQDKEQQLHFAEAAVKRYPTSKVRETQVRW